jgi:3-hydroxybutyryl-CoA dehydratase
MKTWTLEQLATGVAAEFERRIDDADVDAFAELSGDRSPLHVDRAFALRRGYRDRVVHGALLAGLVSRLVGTELPGRNALLLRIRLDFPAPTFPGEAVTIRVEVRCGAELRASGEALVRVREDAP